jgi:hypothetical protein
MEFMTVVCQTEKECERERKGERETPSHSPPLSPSKGVQQC